MRTAWKWTKEGGMEHTQGGSLDAWQVKSLLDGASEQSIRKYLAGFEEEWDLRMIEDFVLLVKKGGGFQYK